MQKDNNKKHSDDDPFFVFIPPEFSYSHMCVFLQK